MKNILAAVFFIFLLIIGSVSQAATTPNSVVTAQTPNRGIVQFLQGTDSAGTYKTLYTAGANGSIVKALFSNTNDASTGHTVTCQIVNSTVKYGGVSVNVAANSGFSNSFPSVNLMAPVVWPGLPLDSDQNPYLILISGDTLQCTYATALTSATLLNIVTVVSDF